MGCHDKVYFFSEKRSVSSFKLDIVVYISVNTCGVIK